MQPRLLPRHRALPALEGHQHGGDGAARHRRLLRIQHHQVARIADCDAAIVLAHRLRRILRRHVPDRANPRVRCAMDDDRQHVRLAQHLAVPEGREGVDDGVGRHRARRALFRQPVRIHHGGRHVVVHMPPAEIEIGTALTCPASVCDLARSAPKAIRR
ncbi:hypothetical protein KPL78_21735 [Roseomonas sp. HJA6]|uniref:Uncharacterized protein n=1 Tax=Roseomonas alba TaxID=2846776 RepID=A0ABS7ADX2_9PROT|nr:hypothetical protein [Neoroseomonas alba]MBW6400496.1 hypothetical protein [Neoroseomonas alba]